MIMSTNTCIDNHISHQFVHRNRRKQKLVERAATRTDMPLVISATGLISSRTLQPQGRGVHALVKHTPSAVGGLVLNAPRTARKSTNCKFSFPPISRVIGHSRSAPINSSPSSIMIRYKGKLQTNRHSEDVPLVDSCQPTPAVNSVADSMQSNFCITGVSSTQSPSEFCSSPTDTTAVKCVPTRDTAHSLLPTNRSSFRSYNNYSMLFRKRAVRNSRWRLMGRSKTRCIAFLKRPSFKVSADILQHPTSSPSSSRSLDSAVIKLESPAVCLPTVDIVPISSYCDTHINPRCATSARVTLTAEAIGNTSTQTAPCISLSANQNQQTSQLDHSLVNENKDNVSLVANLEHNTALANSCEHLIVDNGQNNSLSVVDSSSPIAVSNTQISEHDLDACQSPITPDLVPVSGAVNAPSGTCEASPISAQSDTELISLHTRLELSRRVANISKPKRKYCTRKRGSRDRTKSVARSHSQPVACRRSTRVRNTRVALCSSYLSDPESLGEPSSEHVGHVVAHRDAVTSACAAVSATTSRASHTVTASSVSPSIRLQVHSHKTPVLAACPQTLPSVLSICQSTSPSQHTVSTQHPSTCTLLSTASTTFTSLAPSYNGSSANRLISTDFSSPSMSVQCDTSCHNEYLSALTSPACTCISAFVFVPPAQSAGLSNCSQLPQIDHKLPRMSCSSVVTSAISTRPTLRRSSRTALHNSSCHDDDGICDDKLLAKKAKLFDFEFNEFQTLKNGLRFRMQPTEANSAATVSEKQHAQVHMCKDENFRADQSNAFDQLKLLNTLTPKALPANTLPTADNHLVGDDDDDSHQFLTSPLPVPKPRPSTRVNRRNVHGHPYLRVRDSPSSEIVGACDIMTGDDHIDGSYHRLCAPAPIACSLESLPGQPRPAFTSTLARDYDPHARDPTWLCVFCGRRSHTNAMGDLFGPYFVRSELIIERIGRGAHGDVIGGRDVVGGASSTAPGESTSTRQSRARRVRRRNVRLIEEDDDLDTSFDSTTSTTSALLDNRCHDDQVCSQSQTATATNDTASDTRCPKSTFCVAQWEGRSETWFHERCLAWSPCISLRNGSIDGVEEAISLSQMKVCNICDSNGATVGCYSNGCHATFHIPCLLESGGYLDEETLRSYCSKHVPPSTHKMF